MIRGYRRCLGAFAVCAVVVSGCGALAEDTAIRVGDNTVSMELLDELSSLDEFKNAAATDVGLVSTADGRAGGASYRSAATFLAQNELLAVLMDRFGAEVTDADRAPPEGYDGVSEEFIEPLTEFNARAQAISRVLADQTPTEEERRSYYGAQAEAFDGLTCLDGVSVPAAQADEVRAALDEGEAYEVIAEGLPGEAQLIAPPGEVDCVSDAQLADPALIADLAAAGIDEVTELEQQDQAGTEFVVFLTVRSRGDLGYDEPFVQNRIDAVFAQPETSFEAWVAVVAYETGVDVDPRVGSFNLATNQVDPPPVPAQPAVDTSAPG